MVVGRAWSETTETLIHPCGCGCAHAHTRGGSRAALFVACAEAAPRMRPRQLANSARALAVMKRPRSGDEGARRGALAAVFAGVAGERDWRSGHEVAMAAWACGSSVVAARGDEPFFDRAGAAAVALAGAAAPRLDRYGPKEAADVLWGLGAARKSAAVVERRAWAGAPPRHALLPGAAPGGGGIGARPCRRAFASRRCRRPRRRRRRRRWCLGSTCRTSSAPATTINAKL